MYEAAGTTKRTHPLSQPHTKLLFQHVGRTGGTGEGRGRHQLGSGGGGKEQDTVHWQIGGKNLPSFLNTGNPSLSSKALSAPTPALVQQLNKLPNLTHAQRAPFCLKIEHRNKDTGKLDFPSELGGCIFLGVRLTWVDPVAWATSDGVTRGWYETPGGATLAVPRQAYPPAPIKPARNTQQITRKFSGVMQTQVGFD